MRAYLAGHQHNEDRPPDICVHPLFSRDLEQYLLIFYSWFLLARTIRLLLAICQGVTKPAGIELSLLVRIE